jgi:hypothetical protein
MPKDCADFRFRVVASLLVCLVFQGTGVRAQDQSDSTRNGYLRSFLRHYLARSRSDDHEPTRYSPAFIDLKDDGTREVIVYVTGGFWCGSGGCTTLILAPEGSTYRVVTKIFTTYSPIRILETKSNGWHDIGIMVRVGYGGEEVGSHEQKLSFNGKSYRASTQRSVGKIAGEVVIPATEEGTRLY